MNVSLKSKIISNQTERINEILKERTNDIKYKTEMCKNWEKYSSCRYNNKCRFAHGKNELFSKDLLSKNYKEKECANFFAKGFCLYGNRCCYKHDERKIQDILNDNNNKIGSLNYYTLLKNKPKRLKIFNQLTGNSICSKWDDQLISESLKKQNKPSLDGKLFSLDSTMNDDEEIMIANSCLI